MRANLRWPLLVAITDQLAALTATIWCLGFVRDWLFSSVDPYPYSRSLILTVVGFTPLAAMGLQGNPTASDRGRRPRLNGSLLLGGAGLAAAAATLLVRLLSGGGTPPGVGHDVIALGTGIGSADVGTSPLRVLELEYGSLGGWSTALPLACSLFLCIMVVSRGDCARIGAILGAAGWTATVALSTVIGDAMPLGASLSAALCMAGFRRAYGPQAPASRSGSGARLRAALRTGVVGVGVAAALVGGAQVALGGLVARRLAAAGRAVPLNRVSAAMLETTVATEDRTFFQNPGFDPVAMHSALRRDVREGYIVAGGSGITQQLAKILFLSPERTFVRKAAEFAFALELERSLGKRDILALYLSHVDYGLGRRGVVRAAQGYFHTTPDRLTLAEAALLAAYARRPPTTDAEAAAFLPTRATPLARLRTMGSARFGPREIDAAGTVPLDHLIYPYRAAYDRGATASLPASAAGISLCSWLAPSHPDAVPWAAPRLRQAYLAALPALHRLGVRGIEHVGLFADRPARSNAALPSAHAYGLALDIRAFRLGDGRAVAVADHRRRSVARLLLPLVSELRRRFDVVVDWQDDPLRHDTHVHVEMRKEARP